MEFEYHITVNDLSLAEKDAFVKLCQEEQVKPLMIVLDKGNYIHQPMFTGVIKSADFDEANREIDKMIAKFQENGYAIMRKKVETSPKHDMFFHHPITKHFQPYYEWHGKVEVDDVAMVRELCAGLGGHLSRNSLNPNGRVRFVTVREYESKEKFYERVQKIYDVLKAHHIEFLKEQYELCIYDSKVELDSGWLS